ncbi:hypothetical protein [Candidatus Cardinium hertigii]|uniref:hypothetical protein n=1 Tax=Candidatus Cardinium hertigii TaxID=247481 RepID=UPI003D7D3711
MFLIKNIMRLFMCRFKPFISAVIISLTFTHQASSFMIRPGSIHQDSKRFFYTGIKAQLGYVPLDVEHPKIYCHAPCTYSRGAVGLGALIGRQWVEYFSTELAFESLLSYKGIKQGLFTSESIETDLSFYTLGFGLDCIPMVPVSDDISLLAVLGIGYKKANITIDKQKIFDLMGWKIIPRVGLGVVFDSTVTDISLKLLTEFNNLFKSDSHRVFKPSFLLGASCSLNFK